MPSKQPTPISRIALISITAVVAWTSWTLATASAGNAMKPARFKSKSMAACGTCAPAGCKDPCGCDCGSTCDEWFVEQCLCARCSMPLHYPYFPSMHGYYYFRPYHESHVAKQQHTVTQWGGDPRNPYSNDVFKTVYTTYRAERNERELLDPEE